MAGLAQDTLTLHMHSRPTQMGATAKTAKMTSEMGEMEELSCVCRACAVEGGGTTDVTVVTGKREG